MDDAKVMVISRSEMNETQQRLHDLMVEYPVSNETSAMDVFFKIDDFALVEDIQVDDDGVMCTVYPGYFSDLEKEEEDGYSD